MLEIGFSGTRRHALASLLAAGGAALIGGAAAASEGESGAPALVPFTGDVHDFDYHIGRWTFVNRRLEQRWVGSSAWDEFPGTTEYVQYLKGVANVDESVFPTKGFGGLTLRLFNPAQRRWFIYWINSRNGELGTPIIGGFQGNRGLFYGDDTDEGRPVKVRFIRTKQPPHGELWEQAFSADGGRTWETNWTGQFTRVRG